MPTLYLQFKDNPVDKIRIDSIEFVYDDRVRKVNEVSNIVDKGINSIIQNKSMHIVRLMCIRIFNISTRYSKAMFCRVNLIA